MSDQDFYDFIQNNRWIFAKTYAKSLPHEYCLRQNCVGNIDETIKYIHKNGVRAKFFSREYVYLEVDGYFYFTYEDTDVDVSECKLINRAKTTDYELRKYGEKLYMYRRKNVL